MDFAFSQDSLFLRNIRSHFVAFAGTLNDLDENGVVLGDERHFSCSAFVVDIRGVWCLLTAGHVFQELDDEVRNNRVRLLKCGLADFFSAVATVKEPIPFPYESEHRIVADKRSLGFDCGLIPLRDYYRMHLAASGVSPIPVAPWTNHSPPIFDSYALLGLPIEQMTPVERIGDRGPQIGHLVTLSLVGIDALQSPPPEHTLSAIPRFAGILRDGHNLSSAIGMSGGPILGVSPDGSGGWHYAAVAIQSTWNESNRMIFGTPVSIVLNTIGRLLDKPAP